MVQPAAGVQSEQHARHHQRNQRQRPGAIRAGSKERGEPRQRAEKDQGADGRPQATLVIDAPREIDGVDRTAGAEKGTEDAADGA